MGISRLSAALHANSAQALLKQRRWLEAIEHCNAALRHDPAHAKAAWRGATAAIEVGMHAVAVSFVDSALEHNPQSEELLELRARLGPRPEPPCDGPDSNDEDIMVKEKPRPWETVPAKSVAPPG